MARSEHEEYDDDLLEPRYGRRILIGLLVVAGLLAAFYFVVRSNAFLQAVVLPRLAATVNGTVTVGHIDWDPLTGFTLRDVAVRDADGGSEASAASVVARYHAWSALQGDWHFTSVRFDSPSLAIEQDAPSASPTARFWEAPPGSPWRHSLFRPSEWRVEKLEVKGGVLEFRRRLSDGSRVVSRIEGLDLTSTRPSEEEPAQVTVRSGVRLSRAGAGPGAALTGALVMQCEGQLAFLLSRRSMPVSFDADVRLKPVEATGDYAELAGIEARLRGSLAEKNLRACELRFDGPDGSLGRLELSGVVEPNSVDMLVDCVLTGLDHRVLNLLGGSFGMKFGESGIDGQARIDFSKNGSVINVNSGWQARRLSFEVAEGATPSLDLDLAFDVNLQLENQKAQVKSLALSGRQGTNEVIRVGVPVTINLDWNRLNPKPDTTEANVEIAVNRLDLAAWRPLFGPRIPAGVLDFTGWVHHRDAGRRVRLDFTNRIEQLAFPLGDRVVSHAAIELQGDVALVDYLGLTAEELNLQAWMDDLPLLRSRGSGSLEWRDQEVRFETTTEFVLTNLVAHFPHPAVEVRDGSLRVETTVRSEPLAKSVGVRVLSTALQGRLGDYRFSGHDLRADLAADWTKDVFFLHNAAASCGRHLGPTGTIYGSGRLARVDGSGEFRFQLVNLGGSALNPFLAPYAPGILLGEGAIDGDGRFTVDPSGSHPFELDLKTEKLVVQEARTGRRHFPLTLSASLRGVQTGWRFALGTNIVSLPATKESANSMVLGGDLDFAPTNAVASRLALRADSLDLTPVLAYYRAQEATGARGEVAAQAAGTAFDAGPQVLLLPAPTLKELNGEVTVDKVQLGDLAIRDWRGRVQIAPDRMVVERCEMEVFDRPVRIAGETLRAGGETRSQWKVTAGSIPLAPLTTTLWGCVPGRYIGQVDVDLALDAAGPGDGGRAGRINLGLTNLNFRVLPEWTRELLSPVADSLGAEELLEPEIRYLGGQATSQGGGVWSLDHVALVSDNLIMSVQGDVHSDGLLANTRVDLPVELALGESVAQRLGFESLPPASRPGYVELRELSTIRGTPGSLTNVINPVRLNALLAGARSRPVNGSSTAPVRTAPEPAVSGDMPPPGGVLPFRPDLLAPPDASGATKAPPQ